MPIGTMRSGCGEYHSSKNQSFHALRDREPEVRVAATREHRTAESGDLRREVHRRPHAVDVHVANARVHLVTRGAHLLEARRLDQPVLGLAADHRVEADLEEDLAVELPDLVALLRSRRRAARRPAASRAGVPRTCAAARRGGRRSRRACSGSARGSGSGSSPCVSLLRQRRRIVSPSATASMYSDRDVDRRGPAVVGRDLAFGPGERHAGLAVAREQRDGTGLDDEAHRFVVVREQRRVDGEARPCADCPGAERDAREADELAVGTRDACDFVAERRAARPRCRRGRRCCARARRPGSGRSSWSAPRRRGLSYANVV